MRLIHCASCAARATFRSLPGNPEEPGETVRRVDGRAARDLLCDNCNREIRAGEEATAWSAWRRDQRPLWAWEHEYLRSAYEVPR
jgi:hypothetical protein